MRVTDVTIFSNDTELFNFSLLKPKMSDRFIIKNMIGLDADELVAKFYGIGAVTGQKYYRMVLKEREVVLRIQFNPRWDISETYSQIRDELYRTISSSRTSEVSLLFNSAATTVAKLDGKITKFEVPLFSETPEAQLTIKCEDPIMHGVAPIELYSEHFFAPTFTVGDQFSTAPHGMELQVTFTSPDTDFAIQDRITPNWVFSVQGASFGTGDTLYISSEFGKLAVTHTVSGGSPVNQIMNKVSPTSVWPLIFPGRNDFYVDTTNVSIDFIKFKPAYWGV